MRLLRRAGRFVQLPSSVRTSARRYRDAGIARTVLRNAAAVIAAGADGVAVISALFGTEPVRRNAQDLRARIDAALERRRPAR